MPLVHMKDMVDHAYRHNYAVGAFEMVNLEFLRGVMAAAEGCRAPVILSLKDSDDEAFDFELLLSAVERAAQRASVPVSIHLQHGRDIESTVRAINGGCNGVMVDVSRRDLGENIGMTSEVVAMAHGCGVPVEGTLGIVPEPDGADLQPDPDQVVYTAPAEARGFVDRTGVDFLAVSVGTVRGRMKSKPKLNWQRLKQINEVLGIPLAIYGTSGLNESQFRRLIANGVAKINYYTCLADAAFEQMRASTRGNTRGRYANAVHAVQQAVAEEAERCLRVCGAAGRAAEVLEQCRHWEPVEHVITCDGADRDDNGAEEVMAEGRRILRTIPGVREVCAGNAVRNDGLCRYSWMVRVCHPAVIDTYREHPAYVKFTTGDSAWADGALPTRTSSPGRRSASMLTKAGSPRHTGFPGLASQGVK